MRLSSTEKKMLDGADGEAVSRAMRLLVELGDAYGAERMINVRGAHLFAWKVNGELSGKAVLQQWEQAVAGSRVAVPCTTNPLCLDLASAGKMGVPEEVLEEHGPPISKLRALCGEMGAWPTFSCHYHYPFQPKLGDPYALTESNVCIFANAWYGIHSNMEGDLTALASALTGKTPEYGMHLPENRYGRVLVRLDQGIDPSTFTPTDYGAVSFAAGRMIGDDRIPVYEGLPKTMGPTEAKYMQPQVAHGSAPMFHVVGVTPEAPTVEAALAGRPPSEVLSLGKVEIREAYEALNTTARQEIDLVGIGCPHCTLEELTEIAARLQDKKVNGNVRLFVGTSAAVRLLAARMGLVEAIEKAGGLVLTDMCTFGFLLLGLIERWGVHHVATNSACIASIRAAHPDFVPGIDVRFGGLGPCIQAALTGRWEKDHD